jgi:hypothetical protein
MGKCLQNLVVSTELSNVDEFKKMVIKAQNVAVENIQRPFSKVKAV